MPILQELALLATCTVFWGHYSPNLVIRPPQAGEGKACNVAILESFAELHQWMPWARERPSIEDSEEFARQAAADWILRKELVLWIYDKNTNEFIGASGFHHIDWSVPCCEIGYWLRKSKFKVTPFV